MLLATSIPLISLFFFFNDTATTEIYTLSLHDALPICYVHAPDSSYKFELVNTIAGEGYKAYVLSLDRKSTRLNSSHSQISYAVFCLKKKKIYDVRTTAGLVDKHLWRSCQQHLFA